MKVSCSYCVYLYWLYFQIGFTSHYRNCFKWRHHTTTEEPNKTSFDKNTLKYLNELFKTVWKVTKMFQLNLIHCGLENWNFLNFWKITGGIARSQVSHLMAVCLLGEMTLILAQEVCCRITFFCTISPVCKLDDSHSGQTLGQEGGCTCQKNVSSWAVLTLPLLKFLNN